MRVRSLAPAVMAALAAVTADATSFDAASRFSAAISPRSIAAADFNGDGRLDLAVGGNEAFCYVVLLNAGGRDFPQAVSGNQGIPRCPSVAAADFNGDGKVDLAIAEQYDWVNVRLGSGDGTFVAAYNRYAVGGTPVSVAVGDLNGDGKADLAVANAHSHNVSVLLGRGDGTFTAPVHFTTGIMPYSVRTADFNGDGRADVAVANLGSNNVVILPATGPLPTVPSVIPVGSAPISLATADLNGDGRMDVAVANYQSASVSVALGNGDGTFQAARDFGAGEVPVSVAAGDVDGNAKLDLVVVNAGSSTMSVLSGRGDGTFEPARHHVTSNSPIGLVTADLDGDGALDIAMGQYDQAVAVFWGNGAGTFPSTPLFPTVGDEPFSIVTADFDKDTIPDVAVGNRGYPGGTVSILRGRGDGTLGPASEFPAGTANPSVLAVADLNHDGNDDLVTTGGGDAVWLVAGNGDGSFRTPNAIVVADPGETVRHFAVGDFNLDENPDLAVTTGSSDTGGLWLLIGDGAGGFERRPVTEAGPRPTFVAAADMNNDGRIDLVVSMPGLGFDVLLSRGDGTFQRRYQAAPVRARNLVVGDFNGDTNLDVAMETLTFAGTGDGAFLPSRPCDCWLVDRAVIPYDLNHDGRTDLITVSRGEAQVLIANAAGPFAPRIGFSIRASTSGAIADFNGDGQPDLVVVNAATDEVQLLMNTTP